MIEPVTLSVNDSDVTLDVEPRESLGNVLHDRLGYGGVHVACAQGVCGACTVAVDGEAIRSCLILAVQAAGRRIRTSAAVSERGGLSRLQLLLKERGAVQCGYCTSGVVMSLWSLFEERPVPTVHEIQQALSGHLCRCTGYAGMVEAALAYAEERRDGLDENAGPCTGRGGTDQIS
ncbi:(2Fe-2S)-binding protein [Streptomyces sp. NPDC057271]|uniref:(2Fe-2S)-binding protein n=1 Tax=unclassified Streptomyces TaxID=2593676 RepID=UPI0036266FD3